MRYYDNSGKTPSLDELRRDALAHPKDPDSRMRFARALVNAGEEQDALEQFREAIRLAADEPRLRGLAHMGAGEILVERGDLHEATSDFEEAVRLCPGQPGVHLTLGTLLNTQGDRGRARYHWREVVRAFQEGRIPENYLVSEAKRLLAAHPDT